MQLPYQQLTNETADLVAPEIAMRVGWTKAEAFLGLFELTRWVIKRCPDDAPPSLHAYIDDEEPAALVAMAMSCPGNPDKLLRALEQSTPPVLERRADGRHWLVDARRYDATWLRNRTRAGTVRDTWTAFLNGTGPEPTHSRRASMAGPTGKQAESAVEPPGIPDSPAQVPTQNPQGVRGTSAGHPPESERTSAGKPGASAGKPPEIQSEPIPQTQTQTQITTSLSLRERGEPAAPVAPPAKIQGTGAKGKAKEKPSSNPRHAPLRERLEAVFLEVWGSTKYGWSARDAAALDWMLGQEPDDAAIVARWRIALDPQRTSFPSDVAYLHELKTHWNRFAPPREPDAAQSEQRPISERARGTDEAEAAWAAVLADVRESGKRYALQWLERLTPVRVDRGELAVAASDVYFRDWARDHYGALLAEAADRVAGLSVQLDVATEAPPESLPTVTKLSFGKARRAAP